MTTQPHITSVANPPDNDQLNWLELLAADLTELAGLFHDFGKANQSFQNKLQANASTGEPIRHEYVSWLMLDKLLGQPANDQEWLEKLADYTDLFPLLQNAFADGTYATQNRIEILWKDIQPSDTPSEGTVHRLPLPQTDNTPLLFTLAWLVISHHRLPQGGILRSGKQVLRAGAHIHRNFTRDIFEHCLQPSPGKTTLWSENTWWTEQVAAKATQLRNLLREHPDLIRQQNVWLPFVTSYCRTLLMLGDHVVSSENARQCFQGKTPDKTYFANTHKIPHCKGHMAATLNEHLRGVGRESGSLFRLGLRLMDTLPGISPDRIPESLQQISKDQTSRFYWQDDACLKIRKRHTDGIREGGFFGIVIARTGAGKTRACARIMTHLSTRLRYNLALGLRTLTLQSGTAYREELGLDQTQVSTLVGSEITRRLHEISREASGSESATAENLEVYAIDGSEDVDQALPPQLDKLLEREPNKRLLLTAPILVSTVDYLISAANPNRSRHLYASLRLMTSDLVLDEVDSYSEEDLIVLGKLVYLCGLFGRKVLLASATLPPALAEHFFAAYLTGYQQYCARKQQEPQLFAGWFADTAELSRVERCSETTRFNHTHQKVIQGVIEQLKSEPPQRHACLLPIAKTTVTHSAGGHTIHHLDAIFQAVFAQCIQFHQQHRIIDAATGKRISIGLVRWSNTEPCWCFARYLLNRPAHSGIDHRVLCYHAKLLPVMRFEVERHLDKMLNRHDESNFLQHPLIRDVLDTSLEQEVMIIVSATPIEEIGRDHDFDWAVLEPSSTRAIIQASGRVRRHRESADTKNIALMSTTVRGSKGSTPAFCYPGVESDGYRLNTHEHETDSVYDLSLLKNVIDARLLLSNEHTQHSPITALEHRKLDEWLSGKAPRNRQERLGLSDFLQNEQLALADYHAKHNIFRRSHANLLFWIADDEGNWQHRLEGEDEVTDTTKPDRPAVNTTRYLLPVDTDELYAALKVRLFGDDASKDEELVRQQLLGIESACYSAADVNHKLRFHPLLGAYRLK